MDAAETRYAYDAATIAALRTQVTTQAALIRSQADLISQIQTTFDRAAAAAQIGVWECDLPSETLRWSDTVCDLFEFPRGSTPDRAVTLACYPDEARQRLIAARSEAIARRSSFTLDTEIIGRRGTRRWIRITATVECRGDVPVRIFGLKQDITDERLRSERIRYSAEFDYLTGLANRAVFERHLAALPENGTLLLVDLDGFKAINDVYGHAAGDACLKEAAGRLGATCRGTDLVARIGGDEFAVLITNDPNGRLGESLGQRIVDAMRAPFPHGTARLGFGASVGLARAGCSSPAELFDRADKALYAAKLAGRGRIGFAAPDLSRAGIDANCSGS
ncbi:GGDEF domain-containing protein [Methylobacterium sp. J-078]|uniref:GGDEF domain-containing protein n=1 Tax=Methylobacterium sp. J-078 TaxID=2836657 RepID=UPI001FBA60A0|nr:GGDEF domain-containing protein [Methylobacterium sp. J-078]MCJ2045714.1 GGDEF domain-containing protein [Methylobacterium sp. J-078]